MEGLVDTLEVRDCNLFTEDHLVETGDEESVEEATMEDGHPDDATYKLEIGEMFGVDVRRGVDLEGVAVHGGIGEETIGWIEHVVREQEEPFPMREREGYEHREKRDGEHGTNLETPP